MIDAYIPAVNELEWAKKSYPPMASPHEGYAILKEELDELWEEIKKKPRDRDVSKMRAEVIQVAAMALRFAEDLC